MHLSSYNGSYYVDYINDYEFPIFEDFPDMLDLSVDIYSVGTYNNKVTATIQSTPSVPEYLRGRIAYTREADGRVEIHTYEKGDYSPVSGVFTPSTSGKHIRENTTGPTKAYESGINGKTLRRVSITGPSGNLLSDQHQLKTADGYVVLKTTRHSHDPAGRLLLTTVDGRATYEATWENGRLASETDEQGITTTYDLFDPEGRAIQETRSGIVTSSVFDPSGRTVSTTRSSGSLSLSNATGYDISGRVVSETSENGLTSTTVYTQGGRVTTVTRPDTSTQTTTRYLDGQTRSHTGTGVVARFFDYGADSQGLWTKESIAAENSPQWTQSWQNQRRENHRTSTSGPAAPIVTITAFDPYIEGRAIRRTVPGEADTLYGYDPDTGALFRVARDLNSNGIIDEATDSITDTDTSYIEENGAWYQQSVTSVFQTDEDITPTVLSTTREKLTDLGAGVASVVESIDSQGNKTTRTTTINRATKTVTVRE